MTTTQLREEASAIEADGVLDFARWRTPVEESPDADELRLLALEIIMHDPELAKRLVRAGVQKVLSDSPTAHG